MQCARHFLKHTKTALLTTQQSTKYALIFDLNGVIFSTYLETTRNCAEQSICLRPTNNAQALRLLYDCKKAGHTVLAVSNLSREQLEFMAMDPINARILNMFEDIILPDESGYKKHLPAMFLFTLEKHDLDPQQCIFIDDQWLNIKAAQCMGITKNILCNAGNLQEVRMQLEHFKAL